MADRKSAGGLPFVGNMTEGFDFVRKIWGVTGLPALPTASGITQFAQGLPQALPQMITPTLDVEELDKRIADLRAVEQWLALNANMLHATIQSLEVQRNTIATLKSFGGSMLATVTRSGAAVIPQAPAAPVGGSYLQRAEARASARRKAAADAAAASAATMAAPVSMPAPAAPAGKRRAPARKAPSRKSEQPAAVMPLNPAAWWGALQDQFARVAAVAAAEAARTDDGKAPASAAPAATKTEARPARRKSARPAGAARPRAGGSHGPRKPAGG
jgi:hypothetical protein